MSDVSHAYDHLINQKNKRIRELETHERNLESAIDEIINTVKQFDEELSYDCEKILDKWSWT